MTDAQVLLKGTTLYALMITHKYGTDIWVFTTEEKARRKLAKWARSWWTKEIDGQEMPADDADVIDQYFEAARPRVNTISQQGG
jgi:hypothetical protein